MEKPSTVSAGNEQVLSKKLLPPATQFHHLFPFLFFLCGGTAGVGFLRLWPPIGHFSSFEKLMTGPSPCALWTLTAGARLFEGRRMQFSLLRSSDLRAVKFHALPQNEWHLTRWFGFRCRNINQIVIDPEKKRQQPSGGRLATYRLLSFEYFIWISRQSAHHQGTGDVNTIRYSRSHRWPWPIFFFSRSNVLLDSHGYFAWPWTLKRRFCRVIVNHSSHPVA